MKKWHSKLPEGYTDEELLQCFRDMESQPEHTYEDAINACIISSILKLPVPDWCINKLTALKKHFINMDLSTNIYLDRIRKHGRWNKKLQMLEIFCELTRRRADYFKKHSRKLKDTVARKELADESALSEKTITNADIAFRKAFKINK